MPDEREGWLSGVESIIKMQDPQFKFLRCPGDRIKQLHEIDLTGIDEVIEQRNSQNIEIATYKVGDYVRIISGPFAGTVGQIEEISPKKVYLKVFFLNKQVRMEVPGQHLQFLVVKQ